LSNFWATFWIFWGNFLDFLEQLVDSPTGFGEIMRNIKRAPYQNKIKKISDFAKTYIEITTNY